MHYSDLAAALASPGLRIIQALQDLPEADAVFVLAACQCLDLAQAYSVAFPDVQAYATAELAAAALVQRPDIKAAWASSLQAMFMSKEEALLHASRMARDPAVHARERTVALKLVLDTHAQGAAKQDLTPVGSPEEAVARIKRQMGLGSAPAPVPPEDGQ